MAANSFAEYLSQKCSIPGCERTATYNIISQPGGRKLYPRECCDQHAYAAQNEGCSIWARND